MSESTLVVGQLFNGISVASILLLAALGLALSFGLMRVINMAHGYLDVYAWAAAVTKAKTFDINKVRKAAAALGYSDVGLGKTKFAANQSLIQTAYVGQLTPSGQFKIIWKSSAPIVPVPYDPLTFPGKTCTL